MQSSEEDYDEREARGTASLLSRRVTATISSANGVDWDSIDVYDTVGTVSPPDMPRNVALYHVVKFLRQPFVFLLVLGIASAGTAVIIDTSIRFLTKAQQDLSNTKFAFFNFLLFVSFGMAFSMVSYLVTSIAPFSEGSGIPAIKTILGGVWIDRSLSLSVLLAKIIGLVTAFAGGLSIGKEGPYIHIMATLAHQLSRLPGFRHIRGNLALKLQVLAAACGAGVACAFGAPVGGVLFSIEVTSTYFLSSGLSMGLFCATIAYLVVSLSRQEHIVELFITNFENVPFLKQELVAFGILGVLCGLLGAAFVHLFVMLMRLTKQLTRKYSHYGIGKVKAAHVFGVALLIAVVSFPFKELQGDPVGAVSEFFDEKKMQKWESPNLFVNLISYFVVKFLITLLSVALPLPIGLYTPIFTAGACVGRLFGELMDTAFPWMGVVPGGYAVVGAAGLSAGVTRTVSTAVIVFELTGQLHHGLPILLSVLLATMVGNQINSSIYETMQSLRGLPLMPPFNTEKHHDKTAIHIMRTHLHVLSPLSSYVDVENMLKMKPQWQSFPVVDSRSSMLFAGCVARPYLEASMSEIKTIIAQEEQRLRLSEAEEEGYDVVDADDAIARHREAVSGTPTTASRVDHVSGYVVARGTPVSPPAARRSGVGSQHEFTTAANGSGVGGGSGVDGVRGTGAHSASDGALLHPSRARRTGSRSAGNSPLVAGNSHVDVSGSLNAGGSGLAVLTEDAAVVADLDGVGVRVESDDDDGGTETHTTVSIDGGSSHTGEAMSTDYDGSTSAYRRPSRRRTASVSALVSRLRSDSSTVPQEVLEATAKHFMEGVVPCLSLPQCIDSSVLTVGETTPLAKIHFLFQMLGLGQLYVIRRGVFVGVITKRDIMNVQ